MSSRTSNLPCDSSSIQWASLVIAFISINITWWLFEIPKIWQHGFKPYFHSISWQCLRVIFPGVAGVYALMHANNNYDVAKVFYFGTRTPHERMSTFEYAKVIVTDTLTLVGTVISIYNVCNLPTDAKGNYNKGEWNIASQAFPALPGAMVGFWFLSLPVLRIRKVWPALIGGSLVLAITCISFVLPLVYASPLVKDKLWIMPLMGYIYTAIPLTLVLGFNLFLLLISAVLAFLVRNGMVGISSLNNPKSAPFCGTNHNVFGIFYITFGVIAASLALWGYFYFGFKYSLGFDWRWARSWRSEIGGRMMPVSQNPSNVPQNTTETQTVQKSSADRNVTQVRETIEFQPDMSRCDHAPTVTKTCGQPRTPFQQKMHNWLNTPIWIHLGGKPLKQWNDAPKTVTEHRYYLANGNGNSNEHTRTAQDQSQTISNVVSHYSAHPNDQRYTEQQSNEIYNEHFANQEFNNRIANQHPTAPLYTHHNSYVEQPTISSYNESPNPNSNAYQSYNEPTRNAYQSNHTEHYSTQSAFEPAPINTNTNVQVHNEPPATYQPRTPRAIVQSYDHTDTYTYNDNRASTNRMSQTQPFMSEPYTEEFAYQSYNHPPR